MNVVPESQRTLSDHVAVARECNIMGILAKKRGDYPRANAYRAARVECMRRARAARSA